MRFRPVATCLITALALEVWPGCQCGAMAQQAAPPHAIPQSLQVEHTYTLERLTALAHRSGEVGAEARKALALFKTHFALQNDHVLPPLTLLPELASGTVSPDMRWALAMSDKVKAEQEQIFQEHTEITQAMNALAAAARAAHDQVAQEFAEAALGNSLNDQELLEPMVVVIGDYLRAKLPAEPQPAR